LEIKFISRRSASKQRRISIPSFSRTRNASSKNFPCAYNNFPFYAWEHKVSEYLRDFAGALIVARKITRCTSIFYPVDRSVFTITEKYVCAKIRSDNRYCKLLHRSRRTLFVLCIRNLYRFFFFLENLYI